MLAAKRRGCLFWTPARPRRRSDPFCPAGYRTFGPLLGGAFRSFWARGVSEEVTPSRALKERLALAVPGVRPSPVAQSVTWPSHLMLDGPTQSAPPSHPRNRRVSAISRTPSTSSRRTTSPRARREVGGAAPQVVHLDTGKLGGSSASVPPSLLPKPPCPSPPHPSPLCHSSRRRPPRSS